MTNLRIQKYMVQITDVLSENLKNQATLILSKNFHIIVICLIIKTMLGLIMILIKNRYIKFVVETLHAGKKGIGETKL